MPVMRCARRRLSAVAIGTVLAGVLAWSPCAFALNPSLDVTQYVHTTWRVRDGLWGGAINAIAQTPDGYLWVGTDAGLLRFDGVKSTPWPAPPNQTLPSQYIVNLLTGRDGTLWIATDKGLASWKDAKLRQYDDLVGAFIGRIVEARDGSLWVTVTRPSNAIWTLCAIQGGRVGCYGADGGPGAHAVGLYEDRKGALWVGTRDGLWQWKPSPPRFYPLPRQPNGIDRFAETDDGELLISTVGGVRRLRNGGAELAYPFPPAMQTVSARFVLRDRDGGLWIGTSTRGLVHVHQGITDVFGQLDGLSGDSISQILEDREGNIWVATLEGLDRFRIASAASFSARQGLSSTRVRSVLATRDGSVWVGTSDGLSRLNGSRVTVHREGTVPRPTSRDAREITGRGWPAGIVASLFQDRLGQVWISTERGVGYIENDRFVAVSGLPGGITRAIVEDSRSLWVANQDRGLFQVSADRTIIQRVSWSALNRNAPASAVAADPSKPGLWLGFAGGGVINFIDGQIRAAYGAADGLGEGFVRSLRLDGSWTLWVATDGGLSRVRDGRVTTLRRKNGLPCDAAQWTVEDAQWMWLGMSCGLVRIARSEITGWAAVVDKNREASATVHTTVFANADAVRLFPTASYFSAPAAVAADGRVWFISQDGVTVIDPRDLPFNTLPPPVHVEQITADRKAYDAGSNGGSLRLPPLTRDLQVDFTALSLVAPEKMRFRYWLEGHDTDWQDVGTRRQAFYTNLSPGDYRFRVIAANNSGVWNEAGASVDFAVAPAYYQTMWFRALAVSMVVALAWAAHRIRLRIVETHQHEISALNERMMKAQEQERIRIAGELHDGVMQQMLAVTMMLGTAKRRIADNAEATATLDKIQQKLIQTGTEIRQLSHDLHPPVLQEAGLPMALQNYCEQFSATCGIPIACDADESARELSRGAALAVFRIVQEALGNAAKHAHAKQITVRLTRSAGVVSLVVRDDGVGFDTGRLNTSGGLGLVMMRERASQLNGTFEFESAPEHGTTIRVVIPFR
jgi:signal transduction histidine kinase/ligand-binding sensor domain-containing protein